MRWLLAIWLNATLPAMPMGTLVANISGCYLMGIAVGYFEIHSNLAPEWRLLIITGFLGSLTTFSAFSAEVINMLQQERLLTASYTIVAHVGGSLLMTLAGIITITFIKSA